ncbi:MAG: ABC transporter substrate-binding protein [Chloroflexi bacterium]|nr:ABC transporter substrate-binding protein [Chloroflexota bacterium]
MSNRQFRVISFILIFSAMLLSACGQEASLRKNPPLRVAYNPWPGFLPVLLAQEKGYFAEQNVEVELLYSEDTKMQMMNLAAGAYDAAGLSLGSILAIVGQSPRVRIVLVTDLSNGADAVVCSPEITSVADLKGKRIGAGIGGFGEIFVLEMLKTAGLNSTDVTLIDAPDGEPVLNGLRSKDLAAGQTWEPYVSQAVNEGAKILFTSADTPGLIPDVLAFQSSVIENRPEDVKAFVNAWFQAVDYWLNNPEEAQSILAARLNLPPESVSLDGLILMTREDNLNAMKPGQTSASIFYTANLYRDFYIRLGNITQPIDVNALIDPSFLR